MYGGSLPGDHESGDTYAKFVLFLILGVPKILLIGAILWDLFY